VAKSVATTNLINALAKAHGVQLYETPVGFKYIGELIMQDKIAIGGKRARGCRSGIMCLRRMECSRGCSVAKWCEEREVAGRAVEGVCNQVGSYYPRRENFA